MGQADGRLVVGESAYAVTRTTICSAPSSMLLARTLSNTHRANVTALNALVLAHRSILLKHRA